MIIHGHMHVYISVKFQNAVRRNDFGLAARFMSVLCLSDQQEV